MPVDSRNWDEIIKWHNVYNDKLIVVRLDSALAEDVETIRRLGKQIAFLRWAMNLKIIVVQGSQSKTEEVPILDELSSLVADKAMRELNNRIAEDFRKACKQRIIPISLSGYDNKMIEIHPLKDMTTPVISDDLLVGKRIFCSMLEAQNELFVPIVYPFCAVPRTESASRRLVSIDADELALAVAKKMNAHRLIVCSDVLGILDTDGKLISEVFTDEIPELLNQSKVRSDMAAHLNAAGRAVEAMKEGAVVVVDVRYPDSLLNELLSDQGGGTLIRRRPMRPAERDFSFVPVKELTRRLTS